MKEKITVYVESKYLYNPFGWIVAIFNTLTLLDQQSNTNRAFDFLCTVESEYADKNYGATLEGVCKSFADIRFI